MLYAKTNKTKDGEIFAFLWIKENGKHIPIIRKKLKVFYLENGRKFSWRDVIEPYKVLIAELLLQKTASRPVENVWKLIIEKYPTFLELSKADLSDLEEIIRPLGIHRRAKLLLHLANQVVESEENEFLGSKEKLMKLQGVGDYTASAVLSFGCDIKASIIDTNAARVYTRIGGFYPNTLRQGLAYGKVLGEKVISEGTHKEVNYGILDLSALVCRPIPKCNKCPFMPFCKYAEENNQELRNFSFRES